MSDESWWSHRASCFFLSDFEFSLWYKRNSSDFLLFSTRERNNSLTCFCYRNRLNSYSVHHFIAIMAAGLLRGLTTLFLWFYDLLDINIHGVRILAVCRSPSCIILCHRHFLFTTSHITDSRRLQHQTSRQQSAQYIPQQSVQWNRNVDLIVTLE